MSVKKEIKEQTFLEIMELSRLLGEFGQIKRVVKLPNGENETDSHHSFSLALIAFEFAAQFAPELDAKKILLYSLVHDLPELITGDVNTLRSSPEQLLQKVKQDEAAVIEIKKVLEFSPNIVYALDSYEKKEDEEAIFVYWIDKMITIPAHFYDNGVNLRELGIINREDIQRWYETTLEKLRRQNKPHASAAKILELAYNKMHDELVGVITE
jgi:5'-deoxynucleotidase YfbR-like HD superfamily hydrolase